MKGPKEIADSLTGEEREKYIFSLQSKDTQSLMAAGANRSVIEQALYVKEKADKPIAANAQCLKEDGSVDLNVRDITPEQEQEYLAFRRRRGAWIEETRTAYLMKKMADGKIDKRLADMIETPHVFPRLEIKEKAENAYLRGSTTHQVIKKFKDMFSHLFKPSHAELVAEEMKRMNDGK